MSDLQAQEELREQVRATMASEGIDHVRIVHVDLHGVPRAKVVSAKRFERIMTTGHAWALPLLAADLWQSIPPEETELMSDIGYRNGMMIPDLRTFARLPWTRSTAHVMADVFINDGEAMPSTRQVLEGALEKASVAGYEPVFGSELEFYLYKPDLGVDGFNDVFDRDNPRATVTRVGLDSGLRAGERDGIVSQVLERHRHQSAGDRLAR